MGNEQHTTRPAADTGYVEPGNPFEDGAVETEEEEGDGPEAASPAPATTREPVTQFERRRRKAGRPPGSRNRPKPAIPNETQPGEPDLARFTLPQAGEYDTKDSDPRDALIVWPQILAYLRQFGMGGQDVYIIIERQGLPPYVSPVTKIETVDGAMFSGDETIGSGQALCDYITNVIHLGRQRLAGPALYKLMVGFKTGRGNRFMMTLKLDHPDEIAGVQRRKEQYDFNQRHARAMPPLPRPTMGAPPPQMPAQQMPMPPPPPAPAAGPGPQSPDWFEWAQRYEAWRQSVAGSGQPAPPPVVMQQAPPPPPQPPALSPEQRELIEEATFARRLRALGPDQLRMLGFVPATGPAAPVQAAAVTAAANNPVEALRGLAKTIRDIDSLRGEFGALLGVTPAAAAEGDGDREPEVDEDAPKISKIPLAKAWGKDILMPRNTEGAIDFVQQWFAANPEISTEMGLKFMAGAMKILDGSNFAKVLVQLANDPRTAPVAAAAKAAGMVGTGAAPTQQIAAPPPAAPPVANGAQVRPKAPMA